MPVSVNGGHINDDLSHEASSIHAELVTSSKFRRLPTAWVAVSLILLFVSAISILSILGMAEIIHFLSLIFIYKLISLLSGT